MTKKHFKITQTKIRKNWRRVFAALVKGEGPFVITNYGDPVGVLVSFEEYQEKFGDAIEFDKIPEWSSK